MASNSCLSDQWMKNHLRQAKFRYTVSRFLFLATGSYIAIVTIVTIVAIVAIVAIVTIITRIAQKILHCHESELKKNLKRTSESIGRNGYHFTYILNICQLSDHRVLVLDGFKFWS